MERFSTVNKNLDDPRCIRVGHPITRLAISIGISRCRTRALFVAGLLIKQRKAVLALTSFAVFLGVVQFLGSGDVTSAIVSGLRMLAMTLVFICLLATTKLQDLTYALVTQCKIPMNTPFMFTAALRFAPDFIAESHAVQEAQTCRGLSLRRQLR